MTSGFSYKGINIYTITDNKGSKVPGYNFIGTNTSSTGLRPLPFGLTYQGTPVSNYCTAAQTNVYIASTTVNIPTSCKSFAFYGTGGGGGGGGNGGNANVTIVGGNSNNRSGGAGAAGVKAGYVYGYQLSTQGLSSLDISIGTGGNGGNSGRNSQRSTNAGIKVNASGGDGSGGKSGNATSIKIGNIVYDTNTAPGGNAGLGANVTYDGENFNDENNGANGNTPTPNPQPSKSYGNSANFPALGNYGTGGSGGGGDGAGGALQIIWLYD
jgi:hypothetical protein